MSYDQTLDAMKSLAGRIAAIANDCKEVCHPLDLAHVLEPEYLKAAHVVAVAGKLDEPVPTLCTLSCEPVRRGAARRVRQSARPQRIRDLRSRTCCRTTVALPGRGLSRGALDRALLPKARARIPLFHSVGGLDPLERKDVEKPIGDGLPETLPDWISWSGLVRIKIKLSGEDLSWDVNRTLAIDRVAAAAQARRGVKDWSYCLDFNERCPNVEYVLECLRRVRAGSPGGFDRILYVEQPTARDLKANRGNVMHEASKLRPVVIDESLTDLESLLLARDMGYTGVALKACKGQSQATLMAAARPQVQMFVCLQT